MRKKVQFAVFCVTLCLEFAPLFVATAAVTPAKLFVYADICDAPAPDSFRITGTTANSISIAWKPAWTGAVHTLEVLKKSNTGSWIPLDTTYNVLGSAYTKSGLQYGSEYRFKIATNCPSGENSSIFAIVDGITLIIELTIGGRTPLTPVPVINCPAINYLEHYWVGFKIQNINDPSHYNYFEFNTRQGTSGDIPLVKRVVYGADIVAGKGEEYPKIPAPQTIPIEGVNFFSIFHSGFKGLPAIGTVELTFDEANHTVQICKRTGVVWDANYLFSLMTSANAPDPVSPFDGDRSDISSRNIADFSAQSPFEDVLNIFIRQKSLETSEVTIRLLNMNGQSVFERIFFAPMDQISVPLETLSSGVYILQMERDGEVQTLKVVKSQ